MASQQRVQNYLDRHRISALFEDLMARLVKNMPSEPVPYLIKILHKFDEKAKTPFQENPIAPRTKPLGATPPKTAPKTAPKSARSTLKKDPFSKSTGNLSRSFSNLPLEVASPGPAAKPSLSATAPGYAWQRSSPAGVYGVDRGYERPWIANMKKIKFEQQQRARKLRKSSSTGGEAEGSSTKSSKSGTPSSEADVEQIFVTSTEIDKPPQRPRTLFSSPAAQAWASEMEPEPYRAPPPKPYQPADKVEEAFLAEEISADRLMKMYEKEPSASEEKKKIQQRRSKPDQQAKKHKEELAALIEAQRKVETLGYLDSGGETVDPDGAGYEEATDMREDASDLMDEGVTGVKTTGQKTRRRPPPSAPQVKVGVCSRCANVIGGGDSSTVGRLEGGYGAYTSIDSSSEVSMSSGSDFESASQVSGPRPMAWEGATGEDSRTARSVTARSVTHDQASELFQSSRHQVQTSTEVRSSSQRWETRSYSSETERRATGTDSLLEHGRSWAQPGSDDDSSV